MLARLGLERLIRCRPLSLRPLPRIMRARQCHLPVRLCSVRRMPLPDPGLQYGRPTANQTDREGLQHRQRLATSSQAQACAQTRASSRAVMCWVA